MNEGIGKWLELRIKNAELELAHLKLLREIVATIESRCDLADCQFYVNGRDISSNQQFAFSGGTWRVSTDGRLFPVGMCTSSLELRGATYFYRYAQRGHKERWRLFRIVEIALWDGVDPQAAMQAGKVIAGMGNMKWRRSCA